MKKKARRREPEAVREIRRIRARILRKARRVGIANYFLGLNDRPELVLRPAEPKNAALAEAPVPYRTTLREPQAVREVRAWRRQIQEEIDRVGRQEYLRRLNQGAGDLLSGADPDSRTKP